MVKLKKCPPGVFCIENVTLTIIFVILLIVIYFLFKTNKDKTQPNNDNIYIIKEDNTPFYMKPSALFRDYVGDIFLNPYAPPLKENPFVTGGQIEQGIQRRGLGFGSDPRGVPINVPTSHYDLEYKQVGILTREHGKNTILALFGRPVHSNRNKWQYYTMTEQNNMIKLPLSKGGRSCTGEYGCDEIFNGDTVYVEGYQDAFRATIYESGTARYIPYL